MVLFILFLLLLSMMFAGGRWFISSFFIKSMYRGCVTEELMISCTKVIQSRFSVGCSCKTVLWTFAVAGKQPFALLHWVGERLLLHQSEGLLPFSVHHLHQCILMDVAQFIFGKTKWSHGIYVSVELHDACMSASLCHGTYTRLFAYPVGGVESNNCM